jgi:hypothetical protein
MVAVSRIDTTEQLLIALRIMQLTLQIIDHLIVGGAAASPGHLSFVVKLRLNLTKTLVSQELSVFLCEFCFRRVFDGVKTRERTNLRKKNCIYPVQKISYRVVLILLEYVRLRDYVELDIISSAVAVKPFPWIQVLRRFLNRCDEGVEKPLNMEFWHSIVSTRTHANVRIGWRSFLPVTGLFRNVDCLEMASLL